MGSVLILPGTILDWTAILREADRLMSVAQSAGRGGLQAGMFTGAVARAPTAPGCAPSLVTA